MYVCMSILNTLFSKTCKTKRYLLASKEETKTTRVFLWILYRRNRSLCWLLRNNLHNTIPCLNPRVWSLMSPRGLTSSDWSPLRLWPHPAPPPPLPWLAGLRPLPGPARPRGLCHPASGPRRPDQAEWGRVRPLRANARHRSRAIEIQAIGQHFSLKRPQWYLTLYTKWTNKYQYSDERPRSNRWNKCKLFFVFNNHF